MRILVPVSLGELVDKITILEIKRDEIDDPEKRANVEAELGELECVLTEIWSEEMTEAMGRLRAANRRLWQLEDEIRAKEAVAAFDAEFVTLARSIYTINDQRAGIKKELNLRFGSDFVEEKSYT